MFKNIDYYQWFHSMVHNNIVLIHYPINTPSIKHKHYLSSSFSHPSKQKQIVNKNSKNQEWDKSKTIFKLRAIAKLAK
jgi:hypothetical protein